MTHCPWMDETRRPDSQQCHTPTPTVSKVYLSPCPPVGSPSSWFPVLDDRKNLGLISVWSSILKDTEKIDYTRSSKVFVTDQLEVCCGLLKTNGCKGSTVLVRLLLFNSLNQFQCVSHSQPNPELNSRRAGSRHKS